MTQHKTSTYSRESLRSFWAAGAGIVLLSATGSPTPEHFDAAPAESSGFFRDIGGKTEIPENAFWPSLSAKEEVGSTVGDVEEDFEIRELYGEKSELDEILAIIREFGHLEDGWDGPKSAAPKPGVVNDALTMIQSWPSEIGSPEPVAGFDGNLVLEVYDEGGFSLGGVEFIGEHQAIYTVIKGIELIDSGRFDTKSPAAILQAVAAMKRALI